MIISLGDESTDNEYDYYRRVQMAEGLAEEYRVERDKYAAALKRIADWNECISFDYGSNGVINYYRNIAKEVLST